MAGASIDPIFQSGNTLTSDPSSSSLTRFRLYLQDYGGPIGFRMISRRPDWLEWLIIQNTNAYEVGFTAAWDGLPAAYWKNRDAEAEKALHAFLERDA